MDKNHILSMRIEKETGRIFSGESIWEEIEDAIGKEITESGTYWVTGQDDILMKWEYYVDVTVKYDEEDDQWFYDISLLELSIEDKRTHEKWYIKVKGANL